MILIPAIMAAVFPISWGADWVNEFPALIIAFITPAVLVGMMIPDSFAGERERHTLETLLVSRLPDHVILIGKMLLPIMIGWCAAILLTTISLVVVNIAHGSKHLLLYPPTISIGIVVISFLVATTMAGGGVLASLRAESAQAAAQKLMTMILGPAMIAQIVPLLFMDQMGSIMQKINWTQIQIVFLVLFALIDVVLFITALTQFQRSRMYRSQEIFSLWKRF
jgi:ABC-2 type transport system permease protein